MQPANRSTTQIEGDLHYLRAHRVCETLEMLVRQLLANQPDDPILFICGQLRERCRSSADPSIHHHQQHSREGSLLDQGHPNGPSSGYPNNGKRSSRLSSTGGGSYDGANSVKSGLPLSYLKDQRTQYMQAHPPPPSQLAAPPQTVSTASLMWGTDPTTAVTPTPTTVVEQQQEPVQHAAQGLESAAASSQQPLQGQTFQPTTSSALRNNYSAPSSALSSSRTAKPYPSSTGTAAAAVPAAIATNNPMGSSLNGTEREDRASTRSDVCSSLNFSVSSVDMQEFLAEFRAARNEAFGPMHATVNRSELADIVDRVSIPLPDVRLIGELFDELCSNHNKDRVSFEAFLARMNFKIQGRYPLELIRAVFFGMLPPAEAAEIAIRSATGGFDSLGNTPRSTPLPGQQSSYVHQQQQQLGVSTDSTSPMESTPRLAAKGSKEQQLGGSYPALSASTGPTQPPPAPQPPATLGRQGSKLSAVAPSALSTSVVAAAAATQQTATSETNDTPPAGASKGLLTSRWNCSGVSKKRCVEEGLVAGLGVALSLGDASRILATVGIPLGDDDALLQVTDFVTLVTIATSSGSDE